jgi:hypothetical protein
MASSCPIEVQFVVLSATTWKSTSYYRNESAEDK